MNKNKGIISIGLILAIVLGVAVIGGGAYYLRTKKVEKNDVIINADNKPTGLSSFVTLISPNGGEVYNDSDRVEIKWKGVKTDKDRASIYLRFSSGEWCPIGDVPSSQMSYTFVPSNIDCGDGRGEITSGNYKVTLILYNNEGMAPEPGTAFATSYNDGDDISYNTDSSDKSFKINSEAKTASQKCIDTATSILPAYILKQRDYLDLKINKVSFFALKSDASGAKYFTGNPTNDACMVNVDYSVKLKAGAVNAGNGHESSDGWIVNKSGYATVDKNSNGYYISSMGTGY